MKLNLLRYTRTLLQEEDTVPRAMGSPSLITNYSPTPVAITNTSSSPSPPPPPELRDPFGSSRSPLDSSLALTILVLLTALFFMAFFSLYIRRFSDDNASSDSSTRTQTSSLRQHSQSSCRTKLGGLDPSAVRSLPLIPYCPDEKHPNLNECSICLSEFEESETVKIIPYCRHGFHPMCIDTWLSSHVTCPLCRSSQLFPAVEEVRLDVVRTDEE